jgi:hypothetical protein
MGLRFEIAASAHSTTLRAGSVAVSIYYLQFSIDYYIHIRGGIENVYTADSSFGLEP